MVKKAATPVEDDEEVELEEVADADDAPAKGKKVEDDVWGVRNGLIPLLKEKTGKDYSPREVRTLLRKMARDGSGIEREIVAGNKTRYAWTGPKDPEVLAVLKMVKGGAIEAAKTEALAKLKSDKAAKTAAAAKEKAKAEKAAKAKAAADDDDEEDED